MVSCDFIDISNGEWHILPQNAINVVFEGRSLTHKVDIETSHDKEVSHNIYELTTVDKGDHHKVGRNPEDFLLQWVRVTPLTLIEITDEVTGEVSYPQTIRVYFNRTKF